jgi:hypothetical protein
MSRNFLSVNSLIQYEADDEIIILRVVYVDSANDIAFVINIQSKKGLPEFRKYSRLAEDIADKVAVISSDDPWARIISESELSEKDKQIRDKAWKIIEDLANPENEPAVFYKKVCGKLVQEVAQRNKTTPTTIYKYW